MSLLLDFLNLSVPLFWICFRMSWLYSTENIYLWYDDMWCMLYKQSAQLYLWPISKQATALCDSTSLRHTATSCKYYSPSCMQDFQWNWKIVPIIIRWLGHEGRLALVPPARQVLFNQPQHVIAKKPRSLVKSEYHFFFLLPYISSTISPVRTPHSRCERLPINRMLGGWVREGAHCMLVFTGLSCCMS